MTATTLGRIAMLLAAGSLIAGALAVPAVAAAPAASSPSQAYVQWTHRDTRVCGPAGPDEAACASIVRTFYRDGVPYVPTTAAAHREVARANAVLALTGTDLRKAYGLTAQGDASKIIAIVDAYHNAAAGSHLATFRSQNGLPTASSCTLAQITSRTSGDSPCFTQVNQTGGTTYPSADAGWAVEIDLDLQAASAVCPRCSLLLVEASSASLSNLGTAVTTASNQAHVVAISNSYGTTAGDIPGASYPAWDNAAAKGIAVLASAGDAGYGTEFPASATNVLGVGGTTLSVDSTTKARIAETAWSGTGSGCSVYNAAPTWQVISGSPCGTYKAISDLSAVADPNSGLTIYTTNGSTGWWTFGGTSLAAPVLAALYAIQGGYSASNLAGKLAWAAATPYYDVVSGSNGSCSKAILCTAGSGWDGPTGRGSIAVAAVDPVLTSIAVSPATAAVTPGATQQFTASGLDQLGYSLAAQPSFTWSVDASAGSIDPSTGLFTAAATTGGPFTVRATSGAVSGTAAVSVVNYAILVTPAGSTILAGATQQFTARAYQGATLLATQPTFTWSVSGGGTITSSGAFTAGSAAGTSTVSAAATVAGTPLTGTTQVAVATFALALSPTSIVVRRGGTATTSLTITASSPSATGSVALSRSSLPYGLSLTASNSPVPVSGGTGSSTLSFRASSTARVGTYTITITGTVGAVSKSTTVKVTIQ